MPASGYQAALHVDHIVSRKHGGETELENLALACLHCNQRKGPNIAGRKPANPDLIGKTKIGRVTIHELAIGDPSFRAVRSALLEEGIRNWD